MAVAVLAVLFILGTGAAPVARAQNLSVLHHFTGSDGSQPYARLIRDPAGNLFGTTVEGGQKGDGTVFELVYDKATKSYKQKVLASFSGSNGEHPYGRLLRDSAGNLFGTTHMGGSKNFGIVFELVYNKATQGYQEKVLLNFDGKNGRYPYAGLIEDAKGNLYGTTDLGGPLKYGTVFELVKDASSPNGYSEKLLHAFSFIHNDGAGPASDLIRDTSGDLYGTTAQGGLGSACPAGCGTVFELVPDASSSTGYKEKILYEFKRSDGQNPYASLVRNSKGDIFGTTEFGGAAGDGTVFELTPSTASPTGYTEKVLHSFKGSDGSRPVGHLILDASGNFYSTTYSGGSADKGVVFELIQSAGYHEKVLHSFAKKNDGQHPAAGLVRDSKGDLYGTTVGGGSKGKGTVFKLKQ